MPAVSSRASPIVSPSWSSRRTDASVSSGNATHCTPCAAATRHALSTPTRRTTRSTWPTTTKTPTRAIVEDWAAAYGSGERVLMLATRRADVDRLNALARRHLRHTGQLAGPVLEESGRQFQAGDRVMLRRNDARLNVCNGQTGAVVSVDRAAKSLIVAFDDGACRAVPHNYIAAGGVDHGYATTIHKAQGLTVDRCLVLADELIYRESAYVALSRGRARNQLYVVNDGIDVEHSAHGPTLQRDPRRDAEGTARNQPLPDRSHSTNFPDSAVRTGTTASRSRWNCEEHRPACGQASAMASRNACSSSSVSPWITISSYGGKGFTRASTSSRVVDNPARSHGSGSWDRRSCRRTSIRAGLARLSGRDATQRSQKVRNVVPPVEYRTSRSIDQ